MNTDYKNLDELLVNICAVRVPMYEKIIKETQLTRRIISMKLDTFDVVHPTKKLSSSDIKQTQVNLTFDKSTVFKSVYESYSYRNVCSDYAKIANEMLK